MTSASGVGVDGFGVDVADGGEPGELLDYGLVRLLQEQVADLLTAQKQRRKATGAADLLAVDEEQLALSLIDGSVKAHMQRELAFGRDLPDASFDQRLAGAVFASMYQAGELTELLNDPQVEDIDINGCDEVWVTYADVRGQVRGRPVAPTDADLVDMIQNLAAYAGVNPRPFSTASPQLDLRLHDGSRLSAIITAGERPSVSIRRNRYPQIFLSELVALGTLDEHVAAFLHAAVLARLNIMVAGATSAGKTTLLRAAINCVPPAERLIVIEQSMELGLRRHPQLHPNTVEWEQVLPDTENQGGISLDALVRRSRRQNPSRVIVGEILGPEVVTALTAMSQGNDGSLCTIHARSARDVLAKLANYGAQHNGLDGAAMHGLIAGAVDVIVFLRKNRRLGGVRTVTEVLEVTGLGETGVATSTLFAASPVDGRAVRDPEVQIRRREELEDAGYDDTAWVASSWPQAGR